MLPDGVYSTNFLAMSSFLLSGNNYTKIALIAKDLGLVFPSRTSFNRIQTKCVLQVVDTYKGNLKLSALEEHRAVKVTVSGTSFPEVRHINDMWHGAKNLGKRMSKVACLGE